MNYLLINTANAELVVEIVKGEQIFVATEVEAKRHNEILLPKLQQVLDEAGLKLEDIDEYGVVIGPGSFTGVRVGIATVKAFRDVFHKPVRAINNLDLLYEMSKNLGVSAVAIEGSLNSYFVGKINSGKLDIYERNLTLDELSEVSAPNGKVAFYANTKNYPNAVEVAFDKHAFLQAFLNSTNYDLTPIYYQLSQAENDKINHANLTIQEADVWDIKAVSELDKNNFSNNFSAEMLEQIFASKRNRIFVAMLENELVGFIVAENDIDEINISHVVVDKAYRNHGIGSKLIEFVEQYAKNIQINVVSLEVSVNNFTAKTLYEKLGYTSRRVRKNYYKDGSDAIEMCKNLN